MARGIYERICARFVRLRRNGLRKYDDRISHKGIGHPGSRTPVAAPAPGRGCATVWLSEGRGVLEMSTQINQRRTPVGSVVLTIVGAILGLVALGVLAGGGALLWADHTQRDAAGYFTTSTHEFKTGSYAITHEGTKIAGVPDAIDTGKLARIRIHATSRGESRGVRRDRALSRRRRLPRERGPRERAPLRRRPVQGQVRPRARHRAARRSRYAAHLGRLGDRLRRHADLARARGDVERRRDERRRLARRRRRSEVRREDRVPRLDLGRPAGRRLRAARTGGVALRARDPRLRPRPAHRRPTRTPPPSSVRTPRSCRRDWTSRSAAGSGS